MIPKEIPEIGVYLELKTGVVSQAEPRIFGGGFEGGVEVRVTTQGVLGI